MNKENKGYARNLKSRHIQLIALGGTIGTGLFLGSGKSIHLAGPSIVLAYCITGLICFFLMRAMGELLLSDLNTHSFIDFITKYLGKNRFYSWVDILDLLDNDCYGRCYGNRSIYRILVS